MSPHQVANAVAIDGQVFIEPQFFMIELFPLFKKTIVVLSLMFLKVLKEKK